MNRGTADVLCLITGHPTPVPKRGPRSQYVNAVARDLSIRLRQVESATAELASDVGFTGPAKLRYRRALSAIHDLATGADSRPHRVRRQDVRASVRLDEDLVARIDELPGRNRAAKVAMLLQEALNARSGGAR